MSLKKAAVPLCRDPTHGAGPRKSIPGPDYPGSVPHRPKLFDTEVQFAVFVHFFLSVV